MSTDNERHYFGRAPLPRPRPNPKERGDKSATAKTKGIAAMFATRMSREVSAVVA